MRIVNILAAAAAVASLSACSDTTAAPAVATPTYAMTTAQMLNAIVPWATACPAYNTPSLPHDMAARIFFVNFQQPGGETNEINLTGRVTTIDDIRTAFDAHC